MAEKTDTPRLKSLGEFSLHDLETVRLILRGGSTIDWHRLNFEHEEEVRRFLVNHDFDVTCPVDTAYLADVQAQAIRYLRRNFNSAIPKPVEHASFVELALIASAPDGHRQQCACSILKVMQIIHHMAGRELLFRLPVADRDLFHLVEEKVYRTVGNMLSLNLGISEFIGGRKNLDSTYTKLLSKPESTAGAIYDKLRFRIVTQRREDLLPVLLYLSERVFPFNYVVPDQSTNTMFDFQDFCQEHPHLKRFAAAFQGKTDERLRPGDNRFSAPEYRTVQFVTDVPVRVPQHLLELATPGSESLGKVVYMLCEVQLLDAETEARNETGVANHQAYKDRQMQAVLHRLRLGARAQRDPRARAERGEPSPE